MQLVTLQKKRSTGKIQGPSGQVYDVQRGGFIHVSPSDAAIMQRCGWKVPRGGTPIPPPNEPKTPREALEQMSDDVFWETADRARAQLGIMDTKNRALMTTLMLVKGGYESPPPAPSTPGLAEALLGAQPSHNVVVDEKPGETTYERVTGPQPSTPPETPQSTLEPSTESSEEPEVDESEYTEADLMAMTKAELLDFFSEEDQAMLKTKNKAEIARAILVAQASEE